MAPSPAKLPPTTVNTLVLLLTIGPLIAPWAFTMAAPLLVNPAAPVLTIEPANRLLIVPLVFVIPPAPAVRVPEF